jgi:hypothetical protein
MEDGQQPPDEPASNKLAAFLRDCILGLIVSGMGAAFYSRGLGLG